MLRHLFILIAAFIAHSLYAQEILPVDLVTDRPDQTESAKVVPLKTLQIETGMVFEKDGDINNYAYNTTLLRYGLLDYIELRLGLEYLGEKNDVLSTTHSGVSPLYLGFKIGLLEEDGWRPEIALMSGLVMPFTANKNFEPEHTAADMRIALSNTINHCISIGYNIGVEWDGNTSTPIYNYSIALGYSPLDKLGIFVESYGGFTENGNSIHLLDGGFTFLILDNLQADIEGGFGLNDEALDYFIGFGLSYRIPN